MIANLWLAGRAMAADPLEEYFYASGKIRVVVAVSTLVLAGLLAYVVVLDRRIRKWEKDRRA